MNNYIYTFYEECCTLYRLESRGYTWLDKRRENAPLGGEGERGGGEKEREGERDWPLRGSHVIGILH